MMSSLMLQHSPVRWKEWIPLVTHQQRFRNLIQIIGYNIGKDKSTTTKLSKEVSYYYTLHLSTMCAPFYTSEKISNEHPKWAEINFQTIDPSYGSVTGIVIRVWKHYEEEDSIVTVWGVYFSGLANIDQHTLPQGRMAFTSNTIVFCMHGGLFTSSECLLNDEPTSARITALSLNQNDVRKSYSIDTLCKFHSIQRSMKEFTDEAAALHDKILMGEFSDERSQIKENSPFLRKLLNQSKPTKVSHEQILTVRKDIEAKKFRIQLLQEQHSNKSAELKKCTAYRNNLLDTNQDGGCKLMSRYHTLSKDVERLKEWKKAYIEGEDTLVSVQSQFSYRQKQLIAELAHIYPVKRVSKPGNWNYLEQKRTMENKYTICDVYLPNSENFEGVDDISLSIALGFTAHLVQMISFIINIPLRYPIIHFGSRSKIVDHIRDQIPDKEREFPLFIRSRDKLQFNYAVYLLNKNIAQLRWYCGISTSDLRTTLPNLETLLTMHSNRKTAKMDNSLGVDNLSMSTISRNSILYKSFPSRFNYRKYDYGLSLSLDEGLDKWTGKNGRSASISNVSETCREDGQSSDSVEHDYTHNDYMSPPQ